MWTLILEDLVKFNKHLYNSLSIHVFKSCFHWTIFENCEYSTKQKYDTDFSFGFSHRE